MYVHELAFEIISVILAFKRAEDDVDEISARHWRTSI
jgi:hypothetical protein